MSEQRVVTRWGVCGDGDEEPYATYETEAEAVEAYEGMKLKHQADEHIVRLDITMTTVRDSSEAHDRYWREVGEWKVSERILRGEE